MDVVRCEFENRDEAARNNKESSYYRMPGGRSQQATRHPARGLRRIGEYALARGSGAVQAGPWPQQRHHVRRSAGRARFLLGIVGFR